MRRKTEGGAKRLAPTLERPHPRNLSEHPDVFGNDQRILDTGIINDNKSAKPSLLTELFRAQMKSACEKHELLVFKRWKEAPVWRNKDTNFPLCWGHAEIVFDRLNDKMFYESLVRYCPPTVRWRCSTSSTIRKHEKTYVFTTRGRQLMGLDDHNGSLCLYAVRRGEQRTLSWTFKSCIGGKASG